MLKQKPTRSKKYLAFVRTLPCVVCGNPETQPHHVVGHGRSAMGTKCSDYETFPLCANHHTGAHGIHTFGYAEWESVYGCQLAHVERTAKAATEQGVLA